MLNRHLVSVFKIYGLCKSMCVCLMELSDSNISPHLVRFVSTYTRCGPDVGHHYVAVLAPVSSTK